MRRSKKYLKFLIAMIILFTAFGISYAYLIYSSDSLVRFRVSGASEDFKISVDKTASVLSPFCTLDVGVNLDYTEFTISGTGELEDVYYEIVFEKTGTTPDSLDAYIMIYLTDENDQAVTPLISYNALEDSENVTGKVLFYDHFDKVLNKTYRLRTWIDADTFAYEDLSFDYKLKVHAHR